MAVKFGNNAATLLAANASSSATVLTVSDGSVFPTLSGADYTYVTLEDVNSNREIVKLTAISGNELTVVRAQDGSSARAFSTSDKCELRITAALLNAVSTETVNGTSARFKFTATANQTTFSGSDDNSVTLEYNVGYIDLYLSGIRLIAGSDYTASNGTSIVLAAGASVNDIIEIVSYGTFVLADIAINDMTDVNTTGIADGSILAYDNTDSRFEKSTILSQSSSGIAVVGNITATGIVDGRDIATDGTKLDGIEASADVTDTVNVTAAGALMDSELTSIASVKALNQGVATTDSPTFVDVTATSLDISGNIDVDGTTNLDVVDIDGAVSFGATASFADGVGAYFGTGNDLQIYHTAGTGSYIVEAGSGNLNIRGQDQIILATASGSETYADFNVNGSSRLYYDNGIKIATTSTGIDVTGSVTATDGSTITVTDNSDVLTLISTDADENSGPRLALTRTSASPADNDYVGLISFNGENSASESIRMGMIRTQVLDVTDGSEDSTLTFYSRHGGTETQRLATTSTGIDVTGTATMDGLTVDNITIDGNEIDVSSGDLTLDVAGDIILDADGGDVYFKDGGTTVGSIGATGGQSYIHGAGTDVGLYWGSNNIYPYRSTGLNDATIDLGQSGKRFKDLYLSGTANVGVSRITGQNLAHSASTLVLGHEGSSKSQLRAYGADSSTTGSLEFMVSSSSGTGSHSMTLDSSGRVGIGETVPIGKLHVKTADSGATVDASADEFVIEGSGNAGMSILTGALSTGSIYFGDSGTNWDGYIAYSQNSRSMTFGTAAGGGSMTLNSSGNVGIAKTSLATWSSGYKALQVGGRGFVGAHTGSDLYVGQNASFNGGWKYEASVAASMTQHSGGKITQFVAPAGTAGNAISWNTAIDIDPNGNVGIGGSSATARLEVIGAFAYASGANSLATTVSKASARIRGSSDASTSLFFGSLTNDAEQYIQSSNGAGSAADDLVLNPYGGNVSIGGSGYSRRLTLNKDDQCDLAIRSANNQSAQLLFGDQSADNQGGIQYNNQTDSLHLMANGGVKFDLLSNGYAAFIGASDLRLTLGSQGTAGNNDSNWIRGNGNALNFNSAVGDYVWEVGGSPKMRLKSDGELLVAKSSSNGDAAGHEFLNYGRALHTVNASTVMILNRLSNDGGMFLLEKDGGAIGEMGTSGDEMYLGKGDTTLLFNESSNAVLPRGTNGAQRDNAIDLGSGSNRFDDIYATNGTIQTSDFNEKQDIAELSDAEQRVAVAAKGLLRKFRWKDSVAEKGDDARIHFGIIAQDLQAAFEAEGLDAGDYAMFISTTWTDEETNEEKTRMGVRYSELLAFIISAI